MVWKTFTRVLFFAKRILRDIILSIFVSFGVHQRISTEYGWLQLWIRLLKTTLCTASPFSVQLLTHYSTHFLMNGYWFVSNRFQHLEYNVMKIYNFVFKFLLILLCRRKIRQYDKMLSHFFDTISMVYNKKGGLQEHRRISFSLQRIYIARVFITNKIFHYIIMNKRKPYPFRFNFVPCLYCRIYYGVNC